MPRSNGKQPTQRALQALSAALKVERARARKTQDQMCAGHGFTGSALARWELGRKPNGPSRAKIDRAMGWEPGTCQGFLNGDLKTIEDVDHPRNGRKPRREAEAEEPKPEPLNNEPLSDGARETLAPTDKDAARKALALLLNQAMEPSDPAYTPFTIEIQMPVFWSGDQARKVAEAARKLAQQAVDAYAAQQG